MPSREYLYFGHVSTLNLYLSSKIIFFILGVIAFLDVR